MLPNHGFQAAQTFFHQFYRFFDFSRTRTPVLGRHHPPRAATPSSTGHLLSPTISWPSAINSTLSPVDFYRLFCSPTAGEPLKTQVPPYPSGAQPLSGSLSIFIGILFIRGWGAIKNPVRLGCNIPIWFLVDFC
jgi:hypothetical protein